MEVCVRIVKNVSEDTKCVPSIPLFASRKNSSSQAKSLLNYYA